MRAFAQDDPRASIQYIISGSENLLLIDAILQSLAGRVATHHLPPLSHQEVKSAGVQPDPVEVWIVKGGYPRLYNIEISPSEHYPNYLQMYIDRDIRRELGVVKIPEFNRFITLCATRIGNLVNVQSLPNDCGINVRTAKEWLALLKQSFIVRLLRPYYNNQEKRLIKHRNFILRTRN